MKQLYLIFSIVYLSILSSSAQPESILQTALKKYAETNSYRCECLLSVDLPISLSFKNILEVVRNPADTTCGVYYYFYNDKASPIPEGSSDFTIYNGDAHYMSYKGKILKTSKKEKPNAFKDVSYTSKIGPDAKLSTGIVPSIVKSSGFYHYSLFELAKMIDNDLKNKLTEFSVRSDTIVEETLCYHFEFKRTSSKKDLFLDKQSLLPKLYKTSIISPQIGNRTTTVLFRNFDVNKNFPLSYFSEENLLPSNWEENKYIPTAPKKMVGEIAIDWNLPDLKADSSLSLKQLKGKIVLLEFTATWCVHCMEAAVMMNNLSKRFKDEKNVVLLSIFSSEKDTRDMIIKFAKQYNISNKILYNAKATGDLYKVEGYPSFFVIDSSGIIAKQYGGFSEKIEERISEIIGTLIKSKAF